MITAHTSKQSVIQAIEAGERIYGSEENKGWLDQLLAEKVIKGYRMTGRKMIRNYTMPLYSVELY